MQEKSFILKEEVPFIAGVAILLMVCHHMFGFKDYLAPDTTWNCLSGPLGRTLIEILAGGGNICVAIFALISGHAFWIVRSRYINASYCLSKGLKFLTSYWLIASLFLLFAWATSQNIPDWSMLGFNAIGIGNTPEQPFVNVSFAWYTFFYVIVLIVTPFILRVLQFNHWEIQLSIVIVLFFIWLYAVDTSAKNSEYLYKNLILWPIPSFFLGIICAKSDMIKSFRHRISKFHFNSYFFLTGLLPFLVLLLYANGHIHLLTSNLWGGVIALSVNKISDSIVALLIIVYCILCWKNCKNLLISAAIVALGAESMNIWFIHSIFFTGDKRLQSLYNWTDIALIQFLTVLILSFTISQAVSMGILKMSRLTRLKKYYINNN